MLRELGNADLSARTTDNAVYFDVLGFFIVAWPEGRTVWIALLSLVIVLASVRKLAPRAMTFGVLSFFGAVIVAAIAGGALSWLARLRHGGAMWAATPEPAIVAMWIAGLTGALVTALALRPLSTVRAMLAGHAIVWHVVAIVLAITLPGTSYLFVVPAVAFSLLFALRANETVIGAVTAAVAALLYFPVASVLYEALGAPSLVMVALMIGVFATTFVPVLEMRRRGVAAVFGLAVLCAVASLAFPAYTSAKPQPLSLAYIDDDERGTLWAAPALTPALRAAASFASRDLPPDWLRRPRYVAPAPPLALPRVEATGTRVGNRVTLRLHSPRGANRIAVIFRAADVTSVRVNGVVPPPIPERDLPRRRAETLRGVTVYSSDAEIELTTRTTTPIDLRIGDIAYGLPPAAAPLLHARGNAAVPIGVGDVTITQRRTKV
jgi:hypothetical protein